MSHYYNRNYIYSDKQYNYHSKHRNRYYEYDTYTYDDYGYYDTSRQQQRRQNYDESYNNNNNNINYDYDEYYNDYDDYDDYHDYADYHDYDDYDDYNDYNDYNEEYQDQKKPFRKQRAHKSKSRKNTPARTRYTHFLSIRIKNRYLENLGIKLQQDIVNQYKKHKIEIQTCLINPLKFHISMNVVSLSTQKKLDKFTAVFKLLQTWLKLFILDKSNDKKASIDDDGIFMDTMSKNNYLNKLKQTYTEIEAYKTNKTINTFPLYFEGVNHFNQNVIFLDFKNKCIMTANNNKNSTKKAKTDTIFPCEGTYAQLKGLSRAAKFNGQAVKIVAHIKEKRLWKVKLLNETYNQKYFGVKEENLQPILDCNELVIKLISIFYDIIQSLCKAYDFRVADSSFIPHCTIMKVSKLKGREKTKFIKYNKINKIKLKRKHNVLGDNEKRKRTRVYNVFDLNVLSMALNNSNIDKKTASMKMDDNDMQLCEDITNIDFCAMLGTRKDGYYNIIESLSIIPPTIQSETKETDNDNEKQNQLNANAAVYIPLSVNTNKGNEKVFPVIGVDAQLKGLVSAAKFNGKIVTIVAYVKEKCLWKVKLLNDGDSQQEKRYFGVRKENLEPIVDCNNKKDPVVVYGLSDEHKIDDVIVQTSNEYSNEKEKGKEKQSMNPYLDKGLMQQLTIDFSRNKNQEFEKRFNKSYKRKRKRKRNR